MSQIRLTLAKSFHLTRTFPIQSRSSTSDAFIVGLLEEDISCKGAEVSGTFDCAII